MNLGALDISNTVALNINVAHSRLQNAVKQLSSGLRINSAADDPSGLAIAENLQTVAMGLDEGQRQIQNANNALSVADGAMQTIDAILQRMRSLVVQANSDVKSPQDKSLIQTELDQLRLEIDRVSQNANFNGQKLLDGSLSGGAPLPAQPVYAQNPVVDSGATLIDPTSVSVNPGAEQVQFSLSVDSFDASTDLLSVTIKASSPDPAFGPEQIQSFTVTENTNFPSILGFPTPLTIADQSGNPVLQFNFNNIDRNDVGKTGVVATVPTQQTAAGGHALEVNTGQAEGDTVSVDIAATSTVNLGVNEIVVGDDLANEAAMQRIDYGLQTLNDQRASIGAQTVALGEAGTNAAIQETQQIASESAIRDANIGAETTEFTKDQVISQVATSVLSQMEVNAKSLTHLLLQKL